MQDRIDTLRARWIEQRQKLRRLRQASLRASLVVMTVAALGIGGMILVPPPSLIGNLIGAAVALAPLLLAFCWLIRVPEIWGIQPGWVAATTFLASLPLVAFGRFFAAETVNAIFGEAPDLFPAALMVASYLGALLGALVVLVVIAFGMTLIAVIWLFVATLLGRIGTRRFWRSLLAYLASAVGVGGMLLAVVYLDHVARVLVTRVAITADFHPHHRCETSGWPAGVARVAFVGDEQVLGYLPEGRRVLTLSCRRNGVLGGE